MRDLHNYAFKLYFSGLSIHPKFKNLSVNQNFYFGKSWPSGVSFSFQSEEAYICIYSVRDKDVILFCHEGGIDIGNVEDKATTLEVPVGTAPSGLATNSNLVFCL